jgi:hydrogenase maturation protease
MNDTVIIGIGNILLKDDGVGVYVIKQLENENLPSTIELVDGITLNYTKKTSVHATFLRF